MFVFFFLLHVACRILVPQLGIELALSMTVLSPDHWIAMEFPSEFCFIGDPTEDKSLGDSLSDCCEELFQRGKIGARIYRSFLVCLFVFLLKNTAHVVEYQQVAPLIAERNINNLRYADDNPLMAEIEELKRLFMKVKEDSEKVGLKLNMQNTKIMASGPITSWQIDGETVESG